MRPKKAPMADLRRVGSAAALNDSYADIRRKIAREAEVELRIRKVFTEDSSIIVLIGLAAFFIWFVNRWLPLDSYPTLARAANHPFLFFFVCSLGFLFALVGKAVYEYVRP
jgi:hypothetical protein